MGKKKSVSADRIRIQVSVSKAVHEELLKVAEMEERDIGWLSGHFVSLGVFDEGRKSFGQWLAKRIKPAAKKVRLDQFRQIASSEKVRIHVVIDKAIELELESLAERMDCSPVKIMGLLLDHGIDAYSHWYKFFNHPFGSLLRLVVVGRKKKDPIIEDIPINYGQLDWMPDDEVEE